MKIKKEELSVFKYTNKLSLELMKELNDDLDYMIVCKKKLLSLIGLEKDNKQDIILNNQFIEVVKRCIHKYPILVFTDGLGQARMKSNIENILNNINNKKYSNSTKNNIKNSLKIATDAYYSTYSKLLLVDQCLNLLQTIYYSVVLKGEILFETSLSKLLLISEDAYLNAKNDSALAKNIADFSQLERLMPKKISFEIFVKGKIRESRLAFHMDKHENEGIVITIWDRSFGVFTFKIKLIDNPTGSKTMYTLIPLLNCLSRHGGDWCPKSLDCKNTNCCVEHFCDCKEGRIQMAYAVATCVQEYLIRKEENKIKKALAKPNDNNVEDNVQGSYDFSKVNLSSAVRIDGTITVHNYGVTKRNSINNNNNSSPNGNDNSSHGNSNGFGVQKCPHVRSGYWRTYKSGKKVYVKSCVIHKDSYRGYNSADQL